MTSTITTKFRTGIVALLVALSFAVSITPAADAMPRDCTRMEADFTVFMFLYEEAWGRQAFAEASDYFWFAQGIADRASQRGCDWVG